MKKNLIIFMLSIICFIPFSIMASNTIYDINIDVYLDENGNANITEKWHVDGSDGTEWYKVMDNLGNMELTDFTVSMDGKELIYKNWNVSETLNEKKGYYGINYTSSGMELCFGKYDYKEHTFTLNYTLSNFIFNTEDSQVIYYNFIDTLSNVYFRNFTVNIKSFYEFPDTLDVWGYGYKGYAYVKDGIISMSNEEDMGDNYVVLLAKFPVGTFKTDNSYDEYPTFDSIFTRAEEGTFEYDYSSNETTKHNYGHNIIIFIESLFSNTKSFFVFQFLIFSFIAMISIFSYKSDFYKYKYNKKINKDDVPLFREIPCNKDIYYANALIKLNISNNYDDSNIIGAILLKWVKEDKIAFSEKTTDTTIKNGKSMINLTKKPLFDNELERNLFYMMYDASHDGYLEEEELEKWCKKHYDKYIETFEKISKNKIEELKKEGHIYKRKYKEECESKNVLDDTIYEDSVKLFGLKKYLIEFSNIDTKEVMDVKFWDEYLMFAYLFGIADKVLKQLKNMYPNIVLKCNDSYDYPINYNNLTFISSISDRSLTAANNARIEAQRSSDSSSSCGSGGGGSSSGGGGGGSFGGGGGGSR